MKQALLFALTLLILSIVIIIATVNKTNSLSETDDLHILTKNNNKVELMDFHNFPEEHAIDLTAQQKSVKNQNVQIDQKNKQHSFRQEKVSTKTINKDIIGENIPNWVYNNTTPNDMYYSIVNSDMNVIFFSYADCPIGRQLKEIVSAALTNGRYNNFKDMSELISQGTYLVSTCKKSYKDGLCYDDMRQAGACKCAVNYLLDNCMENICIINPQYHKIVFVPPNKEALIFKLEELRTNW